MGDIKSFIGNLKKPEFFKGIDKRKLLVFCVFFLLIMVIFDTHVGKMSPYSYAVPIVSDKVPPVIDGVSTSPDAPFFVPMANFFYGSEMTLPEKPRSFAATSLPVPAFLTSIFMGLTRSYVFANLLLNVLILLLLFLVFINFTYQSGLSYKTIGVSGVFILLFPFFAHYIGQPMQYITGTAINFLILLAIMNLCRLEKKNPFILGLLTGTLLLNYDPYIFFLAVVLYFIFVDRFERKLDYLYFFAVALSPYVLWTAFIQMIKPPKAVNEYTDVFLKTMLEGWFNYLKNPGKYFSLPFHAPQVGLTAAFKQTIAYIYLPLIPFVGYYVYKFRDSIKGSKIFKLLCLLVGVYLLEMMFASVFDWELNTRRALPVLFVFAFALTFTIAKSINSKKGRWVIAALLVISFVLTFADVLIKDPSIQLTQTGVYIRGNPHKIMEVYECRLDKDSIPWVEGKESLEFNDTQKALPGSKGVKRFVFSQLFLFLVLLALFYSLYKATLLPHYSMWIFCLLFLTSMVIRFV